MVPAVRMFRTHPGRCAHLTRKRNALARIPPEVAVGRYSYYCSVAGLLLAQRFSGVQASGLVTTALIVVGGGMLAAPLAGHGSRLLKPLWGTLVWSSRTAGRKSLGETATPNGPHGCNPWYRAWQRADAEHPRVEFRAKPCGETRLVLHRAACGYLCSRLAAIETHP